MVLYQLSTSGCMSLHARYQSFLAQGLSITSRAYVNSLRAYWPIRASRHTCANQDACAFLTPEHERHLVISFRRLIFPNIFSRLICPSLAIVPFWFVGIETWLTVVPCRRIRYLTNPFIISFKKELDRSKPLRLTQKVNQIIVHEQQAKDCF